MAKDKTKSKAKDKAKGGGKSRAERAQAANLSKPKSINSLLSAQEVNRLVDGALRHQAEVASANSDHGKVVAEAVKKGMNRTAFTLIKMLVKLGRNPKKQGELYVVLAHFDDMRKKVELDELAGVQGDMVGAGTENIKTEDLVDQAKKPGPAVAGAPTTVEELARAAGAQPSTPHH